MSSPSFCDQFSIFMEQSATPPKLVMWGYLGWYLGVIILMERTTTKPFMDGLIFMGLIGFVLNANAYDGFRTNAMKSAQSGQQPRSSLLDYIMIDWASVLRLFTIPFAVSSYSGSASASAEGSFVAVFPVDENVWFPALMIAITLPLSIYMLARILKAGRTPPESMRKSEFVSENNQMNDMEKNMPMKSNPPPVRKGFWGRVAETAGASASPPKLIMWSYLSWYIMVVILMEKSTTKPFKDAVIIMALIGFVLNANAYDGFKTKASKQISSGKVVDTSITHFLVSNWSSTFRLFLIPYCVSSYAGLASSSPEGSFESVFPMDRYVWGPALVVAVDTPAIVCTLYYFVQYRADKEEFARSSQVYPRESLT